MLIVADDVIAPNVSWPPVSSPAPTVTASCARGARAPSLAAYLPGPVGAAPATQLLPRVWRTHVLAPSVMLPRRADAPPRRLSTLTVGKHRRCL
jgi:hypothetical protein